VVEPFGKLRDPRVGDLCVPCWWRWLTNILQPEAATGIAEVLEPEITHSSAFQAQLAFGNTFHAAQGFLLLAVELQLTLPRGLFVALPLFFNLLLPSAFNFKLALALGLLPLSLGFGRGYGC
jgi:hypothetical protein